MSLKKILASEGLTAATLLSPQDFIQKLLDGFTASKTTRIYSDFLNGEHADAYLIAGERYKVEPPLPTYRLPGKGPWAGLPTSLSVKGKFMIVAQPWAVEDMNAEAAQGRDMGGWQFQKGKWVRFVDHTPIGQNIIMITNSKKGPSAAWQKALFEGR